MNEENNNLSIEYVAGLILSFVPALFLNKNNDFSTFGISSIILLINTFLFIRVRSKVINLSKGLIFTSLALAMSIWLFLHSLFHKYTASQEFVIWLTGHGTGMAVFNSDAFSFFMAALVLLGIAVIEVFQKKKQVIKTINYMFIVGSSIIIIAYILIFPDLIISKPKIKLSISSNELIAEKSYGEFFNNGKLIEGYKGIRLEWYFDGKRIGNGIPDNKGEEEHLPLGDRKGTFQVFLTPPPKCENCEKVKSNIINSEETENLIE